MRIKSFKRAMRRGNGLCIYELKTGAAERYRSAVIWGCTHCISYKDPYETREQYLYDMICEFNDSKPFIKAAVNYMKHASRNFSAGFIQSCRLLALFSEDGNEYAMLALSNMRKLLFERIIKLKRNTLELRYALECFNELCVCIVLNSWDSFFCNKNYMSILDDISNIMNENTAVSIHDFRIFMEACHSAIGSESLKCTKFTKCTYKSDVTLSSEHVNKYKMRKQRLEGLPSDSKAYEAYGQRRRRRTLLGRLYIFERLYNADLNTRSLTRKMNILGMRIKTK